MEGLPDIKALKKLADACRKAGIKTFKGYGFEFTLDDEAPKSPKAAKKADKVNYPETKFESDSLNEQDLLFWSTGVTAETSKDESAV